jgi:hypothetical protein
MSNSSMAYFYFDFNDLGKQVVTNFLCSLICQLSIHRADLPDVTVRLYNDHNVVNEKTRPRVTELLNAIQVIAGGFRQTFIIVDALDECTEIEEFVDILTEMTSWNPIVVKVLITGRRERDIELALQPLSPRSICMQLAKVNADIRTYIAYRITKEPRLKRWPDYARKEIEAFLIDGANGM